MQGKIHAEMGLAQPAMVLAMRQRLGVVECLASMREGKRAKDSARIAALHPGEGNMCAAMTEQISLLSMHQSNPSTVVLSLPATTPGCLRSQQVQGKETLRIGPRSP